VFLVEANVELYYCANIVIYIFRTFSFLYGRFLKNIPTIAEVEHIHIVLFDGMHANAYVCMSEYKAYSNLPRWLYW
jgi:hypothetical protein